MDRLREQRGYTLFLTVLMIVVFSILAVTLITVTLSGAKRSEVREDVTQAGELAEKGLKHLMQQIDYDLQTEIDKHPEGIQKSQFIDELEYIINQYSCTIFSDEIVSETGKYTACVENYIDKDNKNLPHKVEIKSVGETDDREKTLLTVVEFSGNYLPDNMEYAANTFIRDGCAKNLDNCLPGEGNMFLHGGVGISGDINVDRNLITSNRSYEKYVFEHWIHSYFPSALPKKNGNELPRVLVGGNVYTLSWDAKKEPGTRIKNFEFNNHISKIDDFPTMYPYAKADQIDENVFVGNYVPEVSNRTDHPGQNELRIRDTLTGKRGIYEYHPGDAGVKYVETRIIGGDVQGIRRVLRNAKFPNDRVIPMLDGKFDTYFIINGESTFKQFSTGKDLHLGEIRNDNKITFKEGLYVGGDVTVFSNTEITGPMYIEGDLIIRGNNIKINGEEIYVNGKIEVRGRKNITLNSVFYVDESFKIRHATPEKNDKDEDYANDITGDHVVYANGDIEIKRVNRFSKKPMVLNAYYYSNKTIQLDGNESNLHIHGGISAPRIILNSIKGRSNWIGFGEQLVEARGYAGWKQQQNADPRLQIHYDDYIFEKYAHLLLESRITETIPPKIISIEN